MTSDEFKEARTRLVLTQQQLADALQLSSRRVIVGYENGSHAIPGPVQVAIRLMLAANREGSAIPPDGQHQGRR